ncbi:MAG: hypothetical protein GEU88_04320 [Solirubrobacterales bacterium]|nr:hypothetical protein [Solirubrobacterales bacterium]
MRPAAWRRSPSRGPGGGSTDTTPPSRPSRCRGSWGGDVHLRRRPPESRGAGRRRDRCRPRARAIAGLIDRVHARLEATARAVASDWGLRVGKPFAAARHSYVAPAGEDAVLKLTDPSDDEADEEPDALALWRGDAAVRLIRGDRTRRAILIERARPGADIAVLPEERATAVAVAVALRLWRPAGAPFRWIGDHVPRWLDQAEGSAGAAGELIPLARDLSRSLGRSTLVHGDLHHHNILDAGGRYLAIDPKPMLGEPEFDVPPLLWNPISHEMTLEVTERRLAAFAAAGLDEERMRGWSVIRGAYLGADLRFDEHDVEVLRALVRGRR